MKLSLEQYQHIVRMNHQIDELDSTWRATIQQRNDQLNKYLGLVPGETVLQVPDNVYGVKPGEYRFSSALLTPDGEIWTWGNYRTSTGHWSQSTVCLGSEATIPAH